MKLVKQKCIGTGGYSYNTHNLPTVFSSKKEVRKWYMKKTKVRTICNSVVYKKEVL